MPAVLHRHVSIRNTDLGRLGERRRCPIHRRVPVLHSDPVLGVAPSSCPRTFPVFRLIKCNRVQALHMTASYSLSGAFSSSASRQCWTFKFVEGQVKRKLPILPP
jgi:hypothetical protein